MESWKRKLRMGMVGGARVHLSAVYIVSPPLSINRSNLSRAVSHRFPRTQRLPVSNFTLPHHAATVRMEKWLKPKPVSLRTSGLILLAL